MAWSHWICDTVTGSRIMRVEVSAASWSRRMNGGIGSGQVTVNVRASQYAAFTPEVWADLRTSWSRTIVGCWDDVPVWAGLIKSPRYRPQSGELVLPHFEVGELLRRRLFWGAGTYSATATRAFTNRSRHGLIVDVAKFVCGGGYEAPVEGIAPWRLPVFFPAPGTGGASRTAEQKMFEKPWDWITDISEESGAPDFVFEPGFGTGNDINGFQWVFHIGTPLERSVHEFHLQAGQSPLVDVELVEDASEQQTGVFALGEGMDEDMLVGQATVATGSVTPAMDVSLPYKHLTSVGALNAAAEGQLAALREPIPVWSFRVRADTALAGMHGGLNDGIRPGSRVRLLSSGDPIVADGVTEFYVTGMSGDMSDLVSLEVQRL